MRSSDDVPGEMHRHDHHGPDEHLVDRLLDGRLDVDDAPRELSAAVELVGALRGPARPDEVADADRVVAMVAAAVHADVSTPVPATRRKSMFGQRLFAKLAVAVAAALGVTAAAAAAGALPGSAQSTIAGALSHVGVSVPEPGHHDVNGTTDDETADPTSTTRTTTAGTDTTTKPGTDDNGDDRAVTPTTSGTAGTTGLCQAFGSGRGGEQGGKLDATAFRRLENEATTAGKTVDELCADQARGSGTGHDDGSTTPTTGTSGEDHGNRHVPAGPPTSNPGEDHHDGGGAPSAGSSSHGNDHGPNGQGGPGDNRGHGGN
jgi:hypothetical protein